MPNKPIIYSKQQLEIVKFNPEAPYGDSGKTLLPVNFKNQSLPHEDPLYGKAIRWGVFDDDLKTYIYSKAVGDYIIADLQEKENPNNPELPYRSITQIYDNGEPVRKKKGGYGKSPTLTNDQVIFIGAMIAYPHLEQDAPEIINSVLQWARDALTGVERPKFKPNNGKKETEKAWENLGEDRNKPVLKEQLHEITRLATEKGIGSADLRQHVGKASLELTISEADNVIADIKAGRVKKYA